MTGHSVVVLGGDTPGHNIPSAEVLRPADQRRDGGLLVGLDVADRRPAGGRPTASRSAAQGLRCSVLVLSRLDRGLAPAPGRRDVGERRGAGATDVLASRCLEVRDGGDDGPVAGTQPDEGTLPAVELVESGEPAISVAQHDATSHHEVAVYVVHRYGHHAIGGVGGGVWAERGELLVAGQLSAAAPD
jgi:hypothetical protein